MGHSVPAPRHMHHVLMDCKCFSSTLRGRMREIRSSTLIVRASTDGRVSVVRDRLRVRKTQEPRKPSPQEPGAPRRSVEIKDLASQRPKRSGIPRGNRGASSFAADLRSKVSVCEFRGPRFARDFRRPAGGRRQLSPAQAARATELGFQRQDRNGRKAGPMPWRRNPKLARAVSACQWPGLTD